ncbi:hypothetical protein A0H81_10136 [Grifola frondosa]|uniref:Uncharacterized protein n=1 Tax=Grifola frondosa TaxID=5627 RepID=A0A1C7LZX5_GRIFR|nr:hypothetical protein A0H81_10136 [Grifola frondosa]
MPKRETTPPPVDENRFLTVVHPYPLHANMELESDRKECAYWLACCIPETYLIAIYHKPSSQNMVIIEVQRDFAEFDKILGEHKWSEFLKGPSNEEKDRVSKLFFCSLNTGRAVQKHGWKRVDIKSQWFRNWRPNNQKVMNPYPKTYRCDVPPEDMTRFQLCRPLPVIWFPPPPPVRPPPVGTPEWEEYKKTLDKKPRPNIAVLPDLVIPSSSNSSGNRSPTKSGASPAPDNPWRRMSPASTNVMAPPGLSKPTASGRSSVPPGISVTTSSSSGEDLDDAAYGIAVVSLEDEEDDLYADGVAPSMQATEERRHLPGPPVVVQNSLWDSIEEPTKEPEELCQVHGVVCGKGICKQYAQQLRQKAAEKKTKTRSDASDWRKGKGNGRGRGRGRGGPFVERHGRSASAENGSGGESASAFGGRASSNNTDVIRQKPAHLASNTNIVSPTPKRPAWNRGPTAPLRSADDQARSTASWGAPPKVARTPVTVQDDDAKSIAASSASGWGNPSEGPWGTNTKPNQSWADEMDDEDTRSVAASTTSGWGNVSNGPW